MAILGLVSTETFSSDEYRFKNIRRSVQYFYPNGAAPLTAVLSLMDEETTNDPEYSHWEKRMVERKTTTVANGSYSPGEGPFTTTAPGNAGASLTWTKDTSYRVYVSSAEYFRVGNVVKIVSTISSKDVDILGIVESINTTGTDYLVVRSIATQAGVVNAVGDVGDEVLVVGSAFNEGVTNQTGEVFTLPSRFTNYCQIFRTPFSMTGTNIKVPVKYDATGTYKDKAKEHSMEHMIDLELAFIFGKRSSYVPTGSASPTTGAGLPVRTTGGILWYLSEYEKQYSVYRGGDGSTTGPAAVTLDTDENKRIIENTAGTITEKQYDGYLERLFRCTNNTGNEKLCLCGSGFLLTMNQMYRSKTNLSADLPLTDTYGMDVVRHRTPFGTVYYKTHPLFSRNTTMRYWGLFLDVRNIKYKPMEGRDTELLKMRQPNDADYRMDEYLTEAGLEMWFPESHMLLKNVRDYTL